MKLIDNTVKTNRKFIAIAVVLGMIILGLILLSVIMELYSPLIPPIAPQAPPTVASPQSQTVDTSDWQTYRNAEFGFEVKYPLDWKFWEEEFPDYPDRRLVNFGEEKEFMFGKGTEYEQTVKTKQIGFGVTQVRGVEITKQDLQDAFGPLQSGESIEEAMFGVEGYKGWRVEKYKGVGVTALVPTVYVYHNGYAYTILGLVPSIIFKDFPTSYNYREIFDQILSTFRFVGENG